jgi:hypothetical protein
MDTGGASGTQRCGREPSPRLSLEGRGTGGYDWRRARGADDLSKFEKRVARIEVKLLANGKLLEGSNQ